jgi:hypothetical protein
MGQPKQVAVILKEDIDDFCKIVTEHLRREGLSRTPPLGQLGSDGPGMSPEYYMRECALLDEQIAETIRAHFYEA